MAKEKTVYVCSNCGQDSPKWVGKCPSCGEWNTYVEEIVRKEPVNRRPVSGIETQKPKPVILSEIIADDEPRINMHDNELNRVLGGGLVPGSLVLIGGEPGIGKSTLVMQTVLRMPEKKILYVSGEESARQLKLRALSVFLRFPATASSFVRLPLNRFMSISKIRIRIWLLSTPYRLSLRKPSNRLPEVSLRSESVRHLSYVSQRRLIRRSCLSDI